MITLASDFGSPYPAAMRGVLLRRTDARLVDVTHDLPRQDLRATAFWLRETLPWFPPATHLAVVDPGVGTDRAAVVVEAGEHTLVGPDNGSLLPPARRLAAAGPPDPVPYRRFERAPGESRGDADDTDDGDHGVETAVYRVDDTGARSSTFHGRDVFAPVAALVHDHPLAELRDRGLLTPLADPVSLSFPEPTVADDRATGEVLVVDDFGNLITNVPGHALQGVERVGVRPGADSGARERVVPAVETFEAVEPGEALATVGSHGNVELDVNRGRGDERFGLTAGDGVTLVVDP
ncbi:NAD operon protein [Halobacteriales archaeon SW_7_71_33]|nr:MAG: NAD operon protein [Halobacteriales archaeon SW_7_71_33]